MADMQDLIARLEKLDGPDREVDAEIYCSLPTPNYELYRRPSRIAGRAICYYVSETHGTCIVPAYTFSIDAALTLVPERLGFEIKISAANNRVCAHAIIGDKWWPDPNGYSAHQAATPAIALCIAALRARSA